MLLMLAVLLPACGGGGTHRTETRPWGPGPMDDLSDPEREWRNALVVLPLRGSAGSMITVNDGGLAFGALTGASHATRWPVIVLIAGCERPVSPRLMRALAEQGYVTFAPDSRARLRQPLHCEGEVLSDLDRATRNLAPRQATINYTFQKLQAQDWVDTDRMFLIGERDGAAAVATLSGAGIAGRVLAEWDCLPTDAGHGADRVATSAASGIRNAAVAPVFAVTSAVVPTHAGDCSPFLGDSPHSAVLALHAKHSPDVLTEPVVFTELLKFLDRRIFR
ncbi:hypothetical protein GCM10007924_09310 [Sneathiella chinensis]|uniref:Alpha/beta hydrolase n=1 Tax=Sneathiella chinensis TaxID=349750 RepID=A0ABQ5U3E6_9PROT|nr:hypothetical protein GCM10007924_09310 [Sneathiella chinensis]